MNEQMNKWTKEWINETSTYAVTQFIYHWVPRSAEKIFWLFENLSLPKTQGGKWKWLYSVG